MISAVAGKLIGGGVKAAAGIGKTIASAVSATDAQNESRQLAEIMRKYEDRREDRGYLQSDEKDARYGNEIMQNRAREEETKQMAASEKGYQRGQRSIDQKLAQLNSNPALRQKTISLFRR